MTYNLENGYVVKLRNGESRIVSTVINDDKRVTILVNTRNGAWSYLSNWNHELKYRERDGKTSPYDIVKVYGYVNNPEYYNKSCNEITYCRKTLWKSDEPYEMTLSEIEKIFGFKVIIVESKND